MKLSYTIRDVVKQNHRDLVEAKIPVGPNHQDYLKRYQSAVTEVINDMEEDEIKELEKTAEKWTKEGVPRELQLKYVFNI